MKIIVDVEKIQEARLSKGYSQRELARQAGVSSLAINYIENRKSEPRPKTIRQICIALDLDVTQICKIV